MNKFIKRAKVDYKLGRESGFSMCCIVWYIIRSAIRKITGKYINLTLHNKQLWTDHILCPICVVKYCNLKKYFFACYYECYCRGDLSWAQFNLKKCKQCGEEGVCYKDNHTEPNVHTMKHKDTIYLNLPKDNPND